VALPTPEALALAEAEALEEEEDFATAPAEALPATTSEDPELAGLEEFQTLATPWARRLLQLLAAAPVLTLPVIRLVRQALLFGDRTPLATAEVLLGGVLQLREPAGANALSISAADSWQFTMAPQVRQRLLSDIDAVDAITVFNAVTRLVEERWNQFMPRGSFRAFLTDPFQPLPPQLSGIEGFASVAAGVLETLGGDYAALARQLRDGAHRRVEEPWPADEFRFEEAEVETGALLPERIPPLQTLTVVVAEWQEIALQTLPFETTTLKLSSRGDDWVSRFFGSRETKLWAQRTQWRHPLMKGSGWCFRQPLASAAEPPSADDLALTMVQIPAGRFLMGSPPKEVERSSDEGPQHEVSLASFFLSQTPITQEQWREVAGWEAREGERWGSELNPNPSLFQSQGGKGEARLLEGEANTNQRPVEYVSWEEAMEFCARLSQRTGRRYTLPSEAQWEYACRAGTTPPFYFGETLTSNLANYKASFTYANGPKGHYREQTTPVGMFPANAWGLQDMYGNVWEWCLDHWHESYEGAPTDGSAWVEEEGLDGEQSNRARLLRGGSWFSGPRYCRSAYRSRNRPGDRDYDGGFRVCCLPQD
jgi:formylglycine-generating enzyme required for sulfatase activity